MTDPLGLGVTVVPTRRRRMGLRARSSAAFAVIGLVLSSVLAIASYERSRYYLLRQRETSAIAQAISNAQELSESLPDPSDDPHPFLSSVENASGAHSLLLRDGRWYAAASDMTDQDLPDALRESAMAGTPTRQRFMVDGIPRLGVVIPIPDATRPRMVYVETSTLVILRRTLNNLSASLLAGAITTIIASAVLGRYASKRVLRPLADISDTARRIASGDLRARLSMVDDPDLSRFVTTFNQMTDSLEAQIRRERQFVSDVGHELRSPLTSLRGAMAIVNTGGVDLPPRVQTGLGILDEEVTRFERMTLDLLEMATMEAGVSAVDLQARSVVPLVEAILSHLGVQAGASPIPLEVDPSAADAVVEVDTRRFERVIDNLVGNARRHGRGATAVRVEAVDGEVLIHVDDAGPGVPLSERGQIFERFARGAGGRHLPGAGLGLALVREHVKLMDGQVEVSDSPDGGARFTVTLAEGKHP